MNLANVKSVHEVLVKVMDIDKDIDEAAKSLAETIYCPTHDVCDGYCTSCWKHWLESEVTTNDHA